MVKQKRKDGYASIGIVDLSSVNLGACGEYDIFDEAAGPLLFATAWCICDGINEKGLGVSLLELSNKHVVEDTDKGDLLNNMTAEEAMGVLDEVAQSTRWSAVYYLENFRVDICFNEDYSNVFSCDGQK